MVRSIGLMSSTQNLAFRSWADGGDQLRAFQSRCRTEPSGEAKEDIMAVMQRRNGNKQWADHDEKLTQRWDALVDTPLEV